MIYHSNMEKEMSGLGVQEGELAIYTGTLNPHQTNGLSSGASRNAYVFRWQDGQPQELHTCFWCDGTGADVLDVQAGEERYLFLRDHPSGYIQQTAGPAVPIAVANLGAIPLRVDTFLGKFTVHAGTMLRLDENAPRREKKKVLLTISSQYERSLKSAEIWDEGVWRRLNICEEAFDADAGRSFIVRDGSAIVQCVLVNSKREILMMDAPEPDPDYEIYVTERTGDRVTLCFNRTDYRDGRVVQRTRTVSFTRWGEQIVYDLQKLREAQTQDALNRCTAELPNLPDEEESHPVPRKRMRPLISDKLREFLGSEDKPSEPLLEPAGIGVEDPQEEHERGDAVSDLEELIRGCQENREMPAPESPEGFPE